MSVGVAAPSALLAAAEATLNHVLAADPEGAAALGAYQGKVMLVELAGFGTRLFLIPGARSVQLYGDYDGEPDCTLRGTPGALMGMMANERREDSIFAGEVEVSGDNHLAQGIGDALRGLDLDWEEWLSRLVGDSIAHPAGVAARNGVRWAQDTHGALEQDLAEYLTEEARILPGSDEVRRWVEDVDRTRDDVERLEARIERLVRAKGSGGPNA